MGKEGVKEGVEIEKEDGRIGRKGRKVGGKEGREEGG